ncbi:MAG: hypothetical protein AAGA37_00640 [Actinomycetota bacterium]
MEQNFFDHVRDAAESLLGGEHGTFRGTSHRRGVKVWIDADTGSTSSDGKAPKEHYEAQLIRVGGDVGLEIGFHAEHRDPTHNALVLDTLHQRESAWRPELGDEAEAGAFLGNDDWVRLSEVWPAPDPDDPEAPMEIAARLADYVDAIESARRQTGER